MEHNHPKYAELARKQRLKRSDQDPLQRVCEKHEKAHVNCGYHSSCPTCMVEESRNATPLEECKDAINALGPAYLMEEFVDAQAEMIAKNPCDFGHVWLSDYVKGSTRCINCGASPGPAFLEVHQ